MFMVIWWDSQLLEDDGTVYMLKKQSDVTVT